MGSNIFNVMSGGAMDTRLAQSKRNKYIFDNVSNDVVSIRIGILQVL